MAKDYNGFACWNAPSFQDGFDEHQPIGKVPRNWREANRSKSHFSDISRDTVQGIHWQRVVLWPERERKQRERTSDGKARENRQHAEVKRMLQRVKGKPERQQMGSERAKQAILCEKQGKINDAYKKIQEEWLDNIEKVPPAEFAKVIVTLASYF